MNLTIGNDSKLGFTAVGLAALLATVAVLPLKYAAAQNATMPQTEETMMTEDMIKARIDKLKSEHPELAAVLDKVQSMDASQTLRALIGTHILERILDAHARNILRFENFTINPTLP